MFWQSAKLQRACRSSAAAETRAAVDAEDELFARRFQAFEILGGQVSVWRCGDAVMIIPGAVVADSKNFFDRLNQNVLTLRGAEKRADIETLCLKESMSSTSVSIRWVNGDTQLANSLTKDNEPQQLVEFYRREGRWKVIYGPQLMSGRKRRQLGIKALDDQEAS